MTLEEAVLSGKRYRRPLQGFPWLKGPVQLCQHITRAGLHPPGAIIPCSGLAAFQYSTQYPLGLDDVSISSSDWIVDEEDSFDPRLLTLFFKTK